MYFNVIISYYQIISQQQDLQEKKNLMYLGAAILNLRNIFNIYPTSDTSLYTI